MFPDQPADGSSFFSVSPPCYFAVQHTAGAQSLVGVDWIFIILHACPGVRCACVVVRGLLLQVKRSKNVFFMMDCHVKVIICYCNIFKVETWRNSGTL